MSSPIVSVELVRIDALLHNDFRYFAIKTNAIGSAVRLGNIALHSRGFANGAENCSGIDKLVVGICGTSSEFVVVLTIMANSAR